MKLKLDTKDLLEYLEDPKLQPTNFCIIIDFCNKIFPLLSLSCGGILGKLFSILPHSHRLWFRGWLRVALIMRNLGLVLHSSWLCRCPLT